MEKNDVLTELIPYFKKDEKLFLLICDYGFGVIDDIKNKFPDRVINIGIREQATIGIAAGMAMAGMKPIVFGMINFLVFRALEQIRNDIVLQKQDVKLIGVGAGDYFKFLGPSHTCGDDDIKILEIVGLEIWDTTNNRYFETFSGTPCNDKLEFLHNFMASDKAGYQHI